MSPLLVFNTMGKEFSITPREVPPVETKYRRIVTRAAASRLPAATLEKLRASIEPMSMRGQPPVVWERAEDIFVYDKYGNRWLDWSSGVLVTNAGHGVPEVRKAIIDQVNSGLLHSYVFPNEERAALVECLADVAPEGLKKVFLLTTGSEATECAIKLSRAHGIKVGGNKKIGIIGWERGFHGRTLGSQQAGGMAGQKIWIVNEDPAIITAPFPDGYWQHGHELRGLPRRGRSARDQAGKRRRRHDGNLPGRRPRLRAGRVRAAAPRVVRPAPDRAHLRRSAGRLRPHRQVLGLRALRRRRPTSSAAAKASAVRCRSPP